MCKRVILPVLLIIASLPVLAQQDSVKTERFSIHAQTTVINQQKPAFSAPYSGENSLQTARENQTSLTTTLYVGARLWKGASLFINPEMAGGSGLSSALGLGAATNGETFRIGDPAPKIYCARAFFKQVINLTRDTQSTAHNYFHHHSDFNQLEEWAPKKYVSFVIGKISLADYFDDNSYSHDPRTQFMNWALMANGAWDYAANTRGYTPGVVLEYVTPRHELRYAAALLPKAANGNDMNWNISKSLSHQIEYTHNHVLHGKPGAVRLLAFYNTTHMGDYTKSVQLHPMRPDTKTTQQYGNYKWGLGLNAEQQLTHDIGAFCRASWNDGRYETWAFTEIDHTLSGGLSLQGNRWKRNNDVVGIAFIASGLSQPHIHYLQAGGKGFMLGDGKLNYGWEKVIETYYNAELLKEHIYITGGYQCILNPGYNVDRKGPVHVFSIRLHCRI